MSGQETSGNRNYHTHSKSKSDKLSLSDLSSSSSPEGDQSQTSSSEPYTLEAEAVAAVDIDNFDQEPSRDFVSQPFSDLLSPNYLGDSTDISQESYIMSQQRPPWLQPMIIQIVQAVTATNPQSVSLPPPTADVTERQRQQQLDENHRAIENFKPFKEGHDLEEYLTQLESQFQLLNIPYDKQKNLFV